MAGIPTKVAVPTCCPSGYTMDLYCDHDNPDHGFRAFPKEFYGQSYRQVAADARKLGWKLHADGTATCPICVKALKIKKEPV